MFIPFLLRNFEFHTIGINSISTEDVELTVEYKQPEDKCETKVGCNFGYVSDRYVKQNIYYLSTSRQYPLLSKSEIVIVKVVKTNFETGKKRIGF